MLITNLDYLEEFDSPSSFGSLSGGLLIAPPLDDSQSLLITVNDRELMVQLGEQELFRTLLDAPPTGIAVSAQGTSAVRTLCTSSSVNGVTTQSCRLSYEPFSVIGRV